MKPVLRGILINSVALWLTSQLINGLKISGGLEIILIGGIVLTMLNLLIKPVLKLLSLPLMILTLGFFSWILNAIVVYILTLFVTQIRVTDFAFAGIGYNGITIPSFELNGFFSAILIAFTLSIIENFFYWVFDFK